LPDFLEGIRSLNFKRKDAQKLARKAAKKLSDESKRLFRELFNNNSDTERKTERFSITITPQTARHLRNISDIANRLSELMDFEKVIGNGDYLKTELLWELSQIQKQAAELANHSNLICWLETNETESRLCAVPKDLDARLYADLWSNGVPTILTSGTLSANGDFSRIKRTLGLDLVGTRLTETSKPSPFDHKNNTLLYISENMPFPNNKNKGYIAALTDEIERLVVASNGHAAVLFTSYNTLGLVYSALKTRNLPFPMLRLERGSSSAIEQFKASGNGILFASGSLWEGIDIPGDALSMLIIVRLPFAVPDPIGEYEQTLYASIDEYKNLVIVPDMLVKLKQGFGRLIRTVRDTGVVAILDNRVSLCGAYRQRVISSLPLCRITSKIAVVRRFYEIVKDKKYFQRRKNLCKT
ncbi:MAG: ATP-dependent DNA helicase, partial [Oscillospiraceae bacterium]|nr:ATP-dependent DNA helicase [Oscillospiraceae bacterium]